MKTGIELIAEERQHQIEDKGYNVEFVKAHPEYYAKGQLRRAALYCLTEGSFKYEPQNWPHSDLDSLNKKEGIEALKVAGALLAAEIDRLSNA